MRDAQCRLTVIREQIAVYHFAYGAVVFQAFTIVNKGL